MINMRIWVVFEDEYGVEEMRMQWAKGRKTHSNKIAKSWIL